MRLLFQLVALTVFCFAAEKNLSFDIVFLIDGSKTAEQSFDNITEFIRDLMSPYNVALSGVRVGLIVVNGDIYDQAPPAATLNFISSQNSLNAYLHFLKDFYADFDHEGQLLDYNLQVVTSSAFMNPAEGYRTNIVNHLLVYITTSTKFDVDPTQRAQGILGYKQYGIITVGLGDKVDHKKLKEISGGNPCSFFATNVNELSHRIKPIQRLIMHADATGGNYCNHQTQVPTTQSTQRPAQTTQTRVPITVSSPHIALQFDIVFLIDGSQSAQSSFDLFTKFVQTMMVTFDVGMAGARVGLVVVAPDLDDQPPPVAQLNSITSQALLNLTLNILKDNYADFDHAGQVLTYNLQVVSSKDFMSASAGYRSNINNHVLVYLTTTTSFYTDPTPSAQSILAQKQYGIITVGYGAAVDNRKLQTISGGSACSFTATDFASLNNQIKPIQQLITNAATNGGNYCKSN